LRLLAKRANREIGHLTAELDIFLLFGDVSIARVPFPPMGLFDSFAKGAIRLQFCDLRNAFATQTRARFLTQTLVFFFLRPPVVLALVGGARAYRNDIGVKPECG
jgi:hypothetical protein